MTTAAVNDRIETTKPPRVRSSEGLLTNPLLQLTERLIAMTAFYPNGGEGTQVPDSEIIDLIKGALDSVSAFPKARRELTEILIEVAKSVPPKGHWTHRGSNVSFDLRHGAYMFKDGGCGYYERALDPILYDSEQDWLCAFLDKKTRKRQEEETGRRLSKKGFIYLLKAEGTSRCKIGLTKDIKQRRKALGKQSPFPVHVICSVEVDDMHAAESYWHQKFQKSQVHGEWFELTPEQVAEFCEAAS